MAKIIKAKDVSVSLDTEKLAVQLNDQRSIPDYSTFEGISTKSSVFVVGNDPRVSSQHLSTPELTYIEVLKDGLQNPYVQVNWQLKREDIDSGQIVSFDVYRRLKKPEESPSFFAVDSFDRDAFFRLSYKNKRVGKFSEEKKAIPNIKRSLIDLSNLNTNLSIQKQLQINNSINNTNQQSGFVGYTNPSSLGLNNYNYVKIGTVDYTKFLAQEKQKFLQNTDRNIATLYFRDKTVGFGYTYEYYIVCITKQFGKNVNSNSVVVTVEDFSPPQAPTAVSIKQTKETEVQVLVSLNASSNPARILIYKKSAVTVSFAYLGTLQVKSDHIVFTDDGVQYGQNYTYRIFVQNIHGLISDPAEVDFFSSVTKVTKESKSNNFKTPILTAVQDQNSDFIKINIFPNDPLIAYYKLERRDLTNKEKSFISPGRDTNGFGGTGWSSNLFFVKKNKEEVQNDQGNTVTKVTFDQIQFVDETVQIPHIYQYRIRGYDLYGNGSSYALALVSTLGKKSVRTPINIRQELLRGFPLRYKMLWDDDNLVGNLEQKDLFTVTDADTKADIIYRVQRRKIGQNVYESFPLTPNNFIVDEVVSSDPVNFANQAIPSVNFTRESSLEVTEQEYEANSKLRRSFGMPNFVLEGDTYFYRVIAVNKQEQESNATEEFKVLALADLSDPVNFGAEILNTKVKPVVARLFWQVDGARAFPDFWTIERKEDTKNEDFRQVGNAYIQLQYFDFNLIPGNTYVYRIRAYDAIGRVSNSVEARLVT